MHACTFREFGGMAYKCQETHRTEKKKLVPLIISIDYEGWEERCSKYPGINNHFPRHGFLTEIFNTDLSGKDDFHLLYGHMVTQGPRRETIRLEEIFPAGGELLCQILVLFAQFKQILSNI